MKVEGFPADKEYRIKTMRPNEQWQSDASYFFVVGWGWYYVISVLDHYSRYILAWELITDMTSASISEVVERAVEGTGMKSVPVHDRTRRASDNGSSYLSHAFEDYLRMLEIRHIRCAPHHPQTNGKIERFHETLKARLNLLVYTSPEQLRAAIAEFIEFYNQRRYHEGIGNVMPANVYHGRRKQILRRRDEQKSRTLQERFQYHLGRKPNRATGEPKPRNRSNSQAQSLSSALNTNVMLHLTADLACTQHSSRVPINPDRQWQAWGNRGATSVPLQGALLFGELANIEPA